MQRPSVEVPESTTRNRYRVGKTDPINKRISKKIRKAVCSGRPRIPDRATWPAMKRIQKQENSTLNGALFSSFTAYKKRGRKTGPAK
ncbi:hypothetical protein CAY57_15065 [Heyndrickxia coagulans]|nr:hypothetical protein CAY57_15065 [Heyndrickxia coagulans]